MPLDSPGPLASLFSLSSWGRRARYLATLIGLCAVATCPGARAQCVARQRTREARELSDYIVDRLREQIERGATLPRGAAGPTPPAGACCDTGGECAVELAHWQTPAWQALAFTIDDPHRYSYQYIPDPDGQGATIRAIGDLDCDTTKSIYDTHVEVTGQGDEKTLTVTRSATAPGE